MNTAALSSTNWLGLPIAALACTVWVAGCSASTPAAPAPAAAGAGSPGQAGTPPVGAAGSFASGGSPAVSGAGGDEASSGAVNATGGSGTASAGAADVAGAGGSAVVGAAGARNNGVAGAGQAGAPSSAACANGALFCDDFETQADMAAPTGKWAARTTGTATVTVDTLHAHSGTKAVHFHSASVNNNQRAYIITQNAAPFPIASDVVYVRFMLYIGRYIIPPGSTAHNRIAWLGGRSILLAGGGAGPGYIFSTYNGIAIERLEKNQGFQRDTTQHLEDASRVGKWQCFEFSIDNKGGVPPGEKSDSTTTAHIWQDGVALKLTPGGSVDSWLAAPFEAVQFTLWSPQTDPQPTDYWIDDVAVSTQRINCPTP